MSTTKDMAKLPLLLQHQLLDLHISLLHLPQDLLHAPQLQLQLDHHSLHNSLNNPMRTHMDLHHHLPLKLLPLHLPSSGQ
jgi:hypothetical protein